MSVALLEAPAVPAVRIRRLADHQVQVRSVQSAPTAAELAPRRRPCPPPPSPHALRGMLAAVLETVDGQRPPQQLADLLPVSEYRALLPSTRTPGAGRRRLCSVHPRRPAADVLELCATVQHGSRARAMVGRLELRGEQWRFTLLRWV